MSLRGKGIGFVAAAIVAAGLAPIAGGTPVASAATPVASVGDLQVVETDIGKGPVTIPVTLDAPAPAAVSVKLAVTGGTATKKADYLGNAGAAAIKKGATVGVAR